MALVLLAAFAAVLGLGIFVESAYGARSAQQLVYQTWWFALLLGLLGTNIFFAAVKKRPWKRQQTGFLITHVGLLTLVAGGLVSSLGGVHGVMTLIDTEDVRFRRFGLPATNVILEPHKDVIRVRCPFVNQDEILYRAFDPGPLPWTADEFVDPHSRRAYATPLAMGLNWLAHPWPRYWAMDLGPGGRLEVLGYYPHAMGQPFAPAAASDGSAFPALAVVLASPATGTLPREWVGLHGTQRTFRIGPGLVEILGRDLRAEQLAEFQNPPAALDAGKNGTLVLGLAGETFRRDVERLVGKGPEPLGKTGWSLNITQYLPNYRDPAIAIAADPGLALELSRPEGKIGLALVARQAGAIYPIGKEPIPWQTLTGLWTWYHPPDHRYSDATLKGILQLVPGEDGTIHYRSFAGGKTGEFHFEKAGVTALGAPRQPIWSGMGWKFQVADYLPRAAPGPHFIPVARPLGQDDGETMPVTKCRLTQGKYAKEFWLAKSDHDFTLVNIGGDEFLVGYHTSQVDLDFALRLIRAEQTTDNGSSLPASQTSFLLLTDPGQNIHGENRNVTLNQPLTHRGYKFYQATYKSLGMDSAGKPISRSVLIAQYDPGLWLKYAGSTMVALGIACMFYMKAYFFGPQRSPTPV
jgi:hypothetical protein